MKADDSIDGSGTRQTDSDSFKLTVWEDQSTTRHGRGELTGGRCVDAGNSRQMGGVEESVGRYERVPRPVLELPVPGEKRRVVTSTVVVL